MKARGQHTMTRTSDCRSPLVTRAHSWLLVAALVGFAACGAGGGELGGSGGPGTGGEPNTGGDPGTGADPGSGGGPGAPGGQGNPLAVQLDFSVHNESHLARTETIRASVPFPRGGYQPGDLDNMVVSGHQTAWMPLQYWPDGRVKVAQAQFTDTLDPGETKQYTVASDEASLNSSFERNSWVSQFAGSYEFGAEVRDTFEVPYRSFATGPGELLQTSALVETRRYRTYHEAASGTGIGRDYLSSTYYVTEFRDMPIVLVDWVIGNDYLGADDPNGSNDPNHYALGDADVRGAWFLCKGASGVLRYRAQSEQIESVQSMSGGYNGFRVMQDTYLSDAQTRRYRFLLRFVPSGAAQADKDRWQDTANAMNQRPMFPLASHQTWQETAAAGLVGGPIAGPSDSNSRAKGEYDSWNGNSWFGTWGYRGDPLVTATTLSLIHI